MWGVYLVLGLQSLLIGWLTIQFFKLKSAHEPKGVPKMENPPPPPSFYKRVKCLNCGKSNEFCSCTQGEMFNAEMRKANKPWSVNGYQPLTDNEINWVVNLITDDNIVKLFGCTHPHAAKFIDFLKLNHRLPSITEYNLKKSYHEFTDYDTSNVYPENILKPIPPKSQTIFEGVKPI